MHIIAGLLEVDINQCFNTAILVTPQGLVGKYRKNHLPFLGIDRFIDPGDQSFQIYSTAIGNIGLHICYDCNFPESARAKALSGVDILVLPTNWPEGRGKVAKYVVNTGAYENKVHLVAVNRVDTERGTRFMDHSKIVDAWGDTLAGAGSDRGEIIYAEISIAEARQERIVFEPGEFELDFICDRRPESYDKLTQIEGS